ncbi:MAG: 2-dehydropantoate 2-reductase [Bacteroidetes bacterium]|nr:2-dehydropantoate 2-reductase [Bacteroidota bacterium]
MNIAVIGTGGVGGYYGGKLSQLLKTDKNLKIFFIARGEHLDEIKRNGLILDTDEGQNVCIPTMATDDISELPELDLCFLCVKSYDLEKVLLQLKPKIAESTIILPLLNGVDMYERVRSVIQNGVVYPSCVYIGTHIEKPGKVTQRGGACIIHLGKDPNNEYLNPVLFEIFKKANIRYKWTDNPYTEIWSKFIFIAPLSLTAANYDKTIGEVLESVELSKYVKDMMMEIQQLAIRKEVFLPPAIIEDSFTRAKKFLYETKTSFQRDYKKKDKPDERDIFGGTIIRLGEQLGIKTETTKMIYNSIQNKKTIIQVN